uniref:Ankyrin repeat and SOCS box containing 16 n=1 Tax=Anser cygnoides TaxID=8845 RepID=A0A8B9DU91_ANSCY
MAQETFAFSSSALRSLRLQRELLEQEERRRALARESATRRLLPAATRPPLAPPRRPQYCRDPAVHNALYTGDLERVKSIFKDEATANMVLETVSEELVWSPEQGLWVLSPRKKQTSALRIAAARGYEDCARHLLLRGAEVDAVVGGRGPLHDAAAAPPPPRLRPPPARLWRRPQPAERRGHGPAAPLHRARQPAVRPSACPAPSFAYICMTRPLATPRPLHLHERPRSCPAGPGPGALHARLRPPNLHSSPAHSIYMQNATHSSPSQSPAHLICITGHAHTPYHAPAPAHCHLPHL